MTIELTEIAQAVLQQRYLLKNAKGEIIETPEEMFTRVANEICKVDMQHSTDGTCNTFKDEIHEMLLDLDFLPNSPTLMNAGTGVGQLSACFVLPVPDSIEGIFDAVKNMAIIHKTGGGTGFSFSELRPRDDLIQSTMSQSSGPVSFMNVFDVTTGAITQGGRRRGANMGILDVNHPDIEDFVEIKQISNAMQNFNLSVAVTDAFINAVNDGKEFPLVNPRTQKVTKNVDARSLFDKIARAAWACGDPGLVFIDEINRTNPTPELGLIKSTNPCGEVPLYSFESCNLGSINLANLVKGDQIIDWDRLRFLVYRSVRFLDDVIDANKYPLPDIDMATKMNRKMGLGVMGFADMLIKMGIRYDDAKALNIGEKVMKFIQDHAMKASIDLGLERGSFPNFSRSIYHLQEPAMRNATRTAIAPTGTISLIAGVSSGIEPIFSVYHQREIAGLGKFEYAHPLLLDQLRTRGKNVQDVVNLIKKAKSIEIPQVPDELKDLYVTAFEIKPEQHVEIQAVFQCHIDNSVSKTINMPETATVEDVKKAFLLAHEKKCKGITVYRYNSQAKQVLNLD